MGNHATVHRTIQNYSIFFQGYLPQQFSASIRPCVTALSCLPQVFTPLLASTAVGTLEFRSVALPVRDIQPALNLPLNGYLTAWARAIDTCGKRVACVTTDGVCFDQPYDHLVIATGATGSTFGIPGDFASASASAAVHAPDAHDNPVRHVLW